MECQSDGYYVDHAEPAPPGIFAARVFLVDGLTSVSLERIELEIEGLIFRRDAGVAYVHGVGGLPGTSWA